MQRLVDVLDRAIADILIVEFEFVANLFIDCIRDADTARLSDSFKPGGEVNRIAEDVPEGAVLNA